MPSKPAIIRALRFDTDEVEILYIAVSDHLSDAKEQHSQGIEEFTARYVAEIENLLERLK